MGSKRKRGSKDDRESNRKKAKSPKADSENKPTVAPHIQKASFADVPTRDERKREGLLYDRLGSDIESDRLSAADQIISALVDGEGVSEPVLLRHLERRLFSGIASGRNASRVGFSLVITELVSQLFGEPNLAGSRYVGVSFDQLLDMLVEKTSPEGSLAGQQERDHYIGQLFGLEAFVRSNVLFEKTDRWNKVLELLLSLAKSKMWLRSQCGYMITQAMSHLPKAEVQKTLKSVAKSGQAKSPEGVAIWLVALRLFPDLREEPWQHPLSKKSLADLVLVLKESFQETGTGADGDPVKTKSLTLWTAQLHFVWDALAAFYGEEQTSGAVDFGTFWTRIIDEGLFSKNATDGQKFKGFLVFQKTLEQLQSRHTMIKFLFSKNFMICLMNQAAKEDRYLHRAAVKALKAINQCVETNQNTLSFVLPSLISGNGTYNFDQRTSSKTVDKLLQNVNEISAAAVLKIIQEPMAKISGLEAAEAQSIIRTFIDYVSKFINSLALAMSNTASLSNVALGLAYTQLSSLAYGSPESIDADLLTPAIRELSRSRLETSLARLAKSADDFEIFCNAVTSIDASSISMDPLIEFSRNEALSRMETLLNGKTSHGSQQIRQGLALLHAVAILQLYNEDPDAMEILYDLSQFVERMEKAADDEDGSAGLLVEICLSMVARPSSLMRQVSQQAFGTFTSHISVDALNLLTEPLTAAETTKGREQIFSTAEEDVEMDDGDESSAASGSDDADPAATNAEVIDVEEASDFELDSDIEFLGPDDMSDDSDSESEDSNKEEETNGDEQTPEPNGLKIMGKDGVVDLDELVGSILKSHRLDKDHEAESSSSDGDMSDSEMLVLDEKLTEIFKHRQEARPDSKKDKKDAKAVVINFKHRILDLLDIYMKKEVLNPSSLTLLAPLLRLMRITSTKALVNRAHELILNLQKGMKKARSNNESSEIVPSVEGLMVLLVEIHDEASKDVSHNYAKASSTASLVVASMLHTVDKQQIAQVTGLYAETQAKWVLGEARLQSIFFTDWNNWCQNQASLV